MALVELKNESFVGEELVNAVWQALPEMSKTDYLFAVAYARQPNLFDRSVWLRDFLHAHGILDADWRMDKDVVNILLSTIPPNDFVHEDDEKYAWDKTVVLNPRKDSSEAHRFIMQVWDTRSPYVDD